MKQKHKKRKLYQASMFLVAAATSSSAMASTCSPGYYDPADGSACVPANLGTYVPSAGATASIDAAPGYFVDTMGASEQTPAPAGRYVPNSGATVANQAPVGFYVPTQGASAPTPVSRGFYTVQSGSSAQMAAGGLAAPMTSALQTSALFNDLATELLDTDSTSIFKLATSYKNTTVKQVGLTNGDMNTQLGAFLVQANLLRQKDGNTGVQFAYGHHDMGASKDLENKGNSFELAAFNSGPIHKGRYQAYLVYGQTHYDNSRNVTDGINLETLSSDGKISWAGVRTRVTYPIVDRFGVLGHLGVLRYSADRINEVGSATSGGSPATSVGALNAKSLNYISTPFTFAVVYDVLPKAKNQWVAPVTFEVGVTGNFSGQKSLELSSTSGVALNLPITQASAVAGVVGLKMNGWKLDNGFHLAGAVQMELGRDIASVRAGLNLVKTW